MSQLQRPPATHWNWSRAYSRNKNGCVRITLLHLITCFIRVSLFHVDLDPKIHSRSPSFDFVQCAIYIKFTMRMRKVFCPMRILHSIGIFVVRCELSPFARFRFLRTHSKQMPYIYILLSCRMHPLHSDWVRQRMQSLRNTWQQSNLLDLFGKFSLPGFVFILYLFALHRRREKMASKNHFLQIGTLNLMSSTVNRHMSLRRRWSVFYGKSMWIRFYGG